MKEIRSLHLKNPIFSLVVCILDVTKISSIGTNKTFLNCGKSLKIIIEHIKVLFAKSLFFGPSANN